MSASEKSARTIHVWIAKLPRDGTAINIADFSPEEQARAALLHDSVARRSFLHRRQFIHQAIAVTFGLNSNEISVAHEPAGRPYLLHAQDRLGIHLSISSIEDRFAIAASSDYPVGIDLEPITANDSDLAARILSPTELKDVNSRPPADAAVALMAYWTRKEAYLKLRGVGLRIEPQQIEVPPLLTTRSSQWQPLIADPAYSVTTWHRDNCLLSLCAPTTQTPPHISIH